MKMEKTSLGKNVWIAEGAAVKGNVILGENVNIWYNAVIRAEINQIVIGKNSNIQDNAVLHVEMEQDVIVGENVTIGHGAIVHGCRVGDNTLIGMGAIILNRAVIGKNCIIGAGALVTEDKVIPDNSVVIGSPAKIVRNVTEEEIAHNLENAGHYVEAAAAYRAAEE